MCCQPVVGGVLVRPPPASRWVKMLSRGSRHEWRRQRADRREPCTVSEWAAEEPQRLRALGYEERCRDRRCWAKSRSGSSAPYTTGTAMKARRCVGHPPTHPDDLNHQEQRWSQKEENHDFGALRPAAGPPVPPKPSNDVGHVPERQEPHGQHQQRDRHEQEQEPLHTCEPTQQLRILPKEKGRGCGLGAPGVEHGLPGPSGRAGAARAVCAGRRERRGARSQSAKCGAARPRSRGRRAPRRSAARLPRRRRRGGKSPILTRGRRAYTRQ